MSLDNPKNIWDAVATLIEMVKSQQTEIDLLKARIEILDLTKANKAGRKATGRRGSNASKDAEAGAVHAHVRQRQGAGKGNGQMPAQARGEEVHEG